jgi:hypothetical protein
LKIRYQTQRDVRQGNNDCEGGGELPGQVEEKKKEARGSGRRNEMKEEESIYPSFTRSIKALTFASSA